MQGKSSGRHWTELKKTRRALPRKKRLVEARSYKFGTATGKLKKSPDQIERLANNNRCKRGVNYECEVREGAAK